MPGFVVPYTGPNSGYPGTVSRNGDEVIVNRPLASTDTLNANFGDIAVANQNSTGGSWSSLQAFIAGGGTFTTAKFAGIFSRNVKVDGTYPVTGTTLPSGGYRPGQLADVVERGSVTVQLKVYSTAPVSEGTVYVRVALNASIPAGVVGGIETAADGTNTVALPTTIAQFKTGYVDANGRTEITLLTRNVA
jgi:hypothetical protein